MKNLSKIIANGLVAEPRFVENLAALIDQVPRVGELLAEGALPPSEETVKKATKAWSSRNEERVVTEVTAPYLTPDLCWRIRIEFYSIRYYERKDGCGSSSRTQDEKHPFEYKYSSYDTLDLQN